jgi:hypothetical protein
MQRSANVILDTQTRANARNDFNDIWNGMSESDGNHSPRDQRNACLHPGPLDHPGPLCTPNNTRSLEHQAHQMLEIQRILLQQMWHLNLLIKAMLLMSRRSAQIEHYREKTFTT